MASIPEEFIEQVKFANDIVDLFRLYADVKKSGRIYLCCCPFHAEKTPSCAIYPESNSFYCFGCHVGGDVIKFITLTENVSYVEAIQILAQRSGLVMPSTSPEQKQKEFLRNKCYSLNRDAANFYYQQITKNQESLQFLKAKQILPETVKQYALGYAPDEQSALYNYLKQKNYSEREIFASGLCRKNQNQKFYDSFRKRMIFPVVDSRDHVIAFGAMAIEQNQPEFFYTDSTPVASKNKIIFLLNKIHTLQNQEFFILAENYFQAVFLRQSGFENVIAIPDKLTAQQVNTIARYTKQILLISSPSAHYGDMQYIRNLCSQAEIFVRIVSLPNHADSAGFIRNYGAEAFRKQLEQAEDAVQNALENSWNGLDEEQDRTILLQKSAAVLAGIKNPLEREVYLTETARKFQLTPEQMQNLMDSLHHQRSPSSRSNSRSLSKEELNFSFRYSRKKRFSEEQILVYLVRFPEKISDIRSYLPPESFMTESYREIYQLICQNEGNFSEFPPKLSELVRKYQEIELNDECISDCVHVLNSSAK